ncbi:hypothetical protein BVC80_8935g18 [Macleaya cordata]|uniref:Membrane-associated kinase regulator 2 n=1 Tax=Macleaya cordata TaxID=56857 RepID=A0A200R865_MACCD|nr:hypothetical protein BVC80_8935g18 [Macleaya cordata]
MEPFNLFKFWRISSGGGGGVVTESTTPTTTGATESTALNLPTTIGATEPNKKLEPDEKDEDGPFFDLEFTVPDDEDDDVDDGGEDEGDCDSVGTDGEREYNFTVSSGSSCSRTDPNLSLSPSDDLFFKGSFVQLESSPTSSEPNSKPQFHVSLLKSATKFRVFMLGFKKTKSTQKVEINGDSPKVLKQSQKQTILQKIKVEEVPIISLFTRENSLRSSVKKQSFDEIDAEEKKFAKDVLQKYLKMIKPLYVRVSKRYGEKMKFSANLSSPVQKSSPKIEIEEREEIGSNLKSQKQGNLPSGLRVVCKHLGKSRSASSAVAAVPPITFQTRKQDDSLFQQEDGIQSAILHCKRSFNSSRDSSLLSRSTSDPSHEKSVELLRSSSVFFKEKEAGKEESVDLY